MSGKSLALAIFAPMAQIPRVRMAPPPGKPWNTVYVTGSENVRIKLAHGWTIVQANGYTDTDIKPEGMSTDPPKETVERIEQVLGEVTRKTKRPRIGQAGATIIALLLSASMFAQDFQQASLHLDKAGKDHQASIIVPVLCGIVAAGMASQSKDQTPPAMILGVGLFVGVSLNLSSASHTRKAAKYLKP
jgi:hypothetical protein